MQFFLLNAIEGFMCVYICVNLNKNVTVSKFVLAWFLCTFTIYVYPIIIPMPVIPQILACMVNIYIISNMYNLNILKCVLNIFVVYFVIGLVCDISYYALAVKMFNFNPLFEASILKVFLYSLPMRIAQLLLIFLYKKVVDIYEKH
jgi:hypothetical protein